MSHILSIIDAYRHRSSEVPVRFSEFVPELEDCICGAVEKNEPNHFILPAFPFKFPREGGNKKSLGPLPDKGEKFALRLLDGVAGEVGEVYGGGAKVVIVADL